MAHEPSCPVGLGVAAITDDDREWFERHPWAPSRRRRVTWAERIELRTVLGVESPHHVWVSEVAPGVRVRHFGGAS